MTKASIIEKAATESSSGPSLPAIRIDMVCIEFCNMYERITGRNQLFVRRQASGAIKRKD